MTGQVGGTRESGRLRSIPEATVARLALYLQVLTALGDGTGAQETISSDQLARSAGVNSAKLRKDLSYLGSYGIRGVGYDVRILTEEISRTLGAHRAHRVALVGLGNLGQALAGYPGFAGRGFVVSALFDIDPARVGREIGGRVVQHLDDAVAVCRAAGVTIGVITTPATAAQRVADILVAAGIRSILNFAPGVLSIPGDVEVRHVDLALELQILAFHESRRDADRIGPRVLATTEHATDAPPAFHPAETPRVAVTS
ncbi:redox-sensing transcriptional repressor Rex [Nakamurella sp.]|uniref:redox-sensing transcriptional repressor Rex n=1 Tax=Nakamurella sp. TaxID=1869182 RepID=UPI003B3B940D